MEVLVAGARLRDFATAILRSTGADPAEARIVADALVWSDARGRAPQGVARLPSHVARLRRGRICSPATLEWERLGGAAWRLHAGEAFGAVAGVAAIERALATARDSGVAAVVVRDSNLFGAAGYYCSLAAARGAIGIAASNAAAKVAPHGGVRPVLGTNPLAFACPTLAGPPILVDLATSAIAGSTLRDLARSGDALEPGVALDRDGRPTLDPVAAESGCLLPAAGAKGFALGLLVEILAGVLAGAAVGPGVGSFFDGSRAADTGHFFVVIDLERFLGGERFVARLEPLLESLHAAGRAPGDVRLPGEARAMLADLHRERGIPIVAETRLALERLAFDLGEPPPWSATPAAPEGLSCR